MKVTLLQQNIVWANPEANVKHIDELLAKAAEMIERALPAFRALADSYK